MMALLACYKSNNYGRLSPPHAAVAAVGSFCPVLPTANACAHPICLSSLTCLFVLRIALRGARSRTGGKCTAEEEALTACAAQQAELEKTKDTSRYHLMRLVRQMRRL